MNVNISIAQFQEKLAQDPIRWHLFKKELVYLLIAAVTVGVVWILVNAVYIRVYSIDKLLTHQDKEVLAITNAEIDDTLTLVSDKTEVAMVMPRSFGEEVQVKTIDKENPFVPLVEPKLTEGIPQEKIEIPQLPLEDQLRLEGVAKVGRNYLIIIADANGKSQVLSRGETFNGWQAQSIEAERVRFIRGEQSLVLAWEGN